MIADGLHRAGWSWGCMGYITRAGRKMHCADAHRDGKRYVVHAEEIGHDAAAPSLRRLTSSRSRCIAPRDCVRRILRRSAITQGNARRLLPRA